MASGPQINDFEGPIRRIFNGEAVSGMDEGELLRRFATRRDPSALEAIVVRHGPMVLGVCRRVLPNRDASEDAFQATFLVLARRAGTIRDPDRLGSWLHGVAHRVAVRARADQARRQTRERTGTDEPAMAMAVASRGPESDRTEVRAAVDEEVRRLPEKFRDPIILCYLDGLTHDEAAARLHCPVGTVRSRLATGRDRLRDRLSRRGVTVPSGVFAGVLTAEAASAAISPLLLMATVRGSTAFAASMTGATTAGLVSASVVALAEGVTTTMIVSKLKIVAGVALVGVMTLGVGAATAQKLGGPAQGEAVIQKAAPKPEADTKLEGPAQGEAVIQKADPKPEAPQTDPKELEAELLRLMSELARSQRDTTLFETKIKAITEQLEAAKGREQNALLAPKTSGPGISKEGNGVIGGDAAISGVGGRGISRPLRMAGTGGMAGPSLGRFQREDYVIIHKPRTDKVAAYSTDSGEWASYDVPKGVEVLPILGDGLVALQETGEIRQVAVFVPKTSRWYPLELKEEFKGQASPIVNSTMAIYPLGRYIYAFSCVTQTWDTIKLEEDRKWTTAFQYNRFTIELDDHLYIFSAKTGKWTNFDAKTGQVVVPEKK